MGTRRVQRRKRGGSTFPHSGLPETLQNPHQIFIFPDEETEAREVGHVAPGGRAGTRIPLLQGCVVCVTSLLSLWTGGLWWETLQATTFQGWPLRGTGDVCILRGSFEGRLMIRKEEQAGGAGRASTLQASFTVTQPPLSDQICHLSVTWTTHQECISTGTQVMTWPPKSVLSVEGKRDGRTIWLLGSSSREH